MKHLNSSSNKPGISIIIPIYNESDNIGDLLGFLLSIKGDCEIIFVDCGSSDDTVKKISDWIGEDTSSPCFLLLAPKKGRANQMNYGASLAQCGILWFLHADSIPPEDALNQIRKIINNGHSFGCFRIRFDSKHPLMLYNTLMSNFRAKVRKIAFGDQGIFISKEIFEEIGGYSSIPLMEDYELSAKMKCAGYSLKVAKGSIKTSQGRYLANGRLRTMLRMQILQHRFRRGDDIEKIAADYEIRR